MINIVESKIEIASEELLLGRFCIKVVPEIHMSLCLFGYEHTDTMVIERGIEDDKYK